MIKWLYDIRTLDLGDGTAVFYMKRPRDIVTDAPAQGMVLGGREQLRIKTILYWGYWLIVAYMALPRSYLLARLTGTEVSPLLAVLAFFLGLIAFILVWQWAQWRFLARCKPREPKFRYDDSAAFAEKSRRYPFRHLLVFLGPVLLASVGSTLLDTLLT